MVYSEDTVSRRLYDLKLLDIESGVLQADEIKNTNGECIWSTDNLYFFYVKKDIDTLRDYCVCRHKLGTSDSEDVEIYNESDDTFYVSISKSRSNKFLIIFFKFEFVLAGIQIFSLAFVYFNSKHEKVNGIFLLKM